MHMTAARLNEIEKLDPRIIPVITVSGRMCEFYAQSSVKCAVRRNFGEYALDRKAHAI